MGVSSHYNFGNNSNNKGDGAQIKEGENGTLYRDDGLPVNALYSNFVKQGSYSKKDSALKYGDGRAIKRNFDDCTAIPPDNESDGGSSGSGSSSNNSRAKKRKKAEKKALKKAEKLEAKKKVNTYKKI